MTTKTETQKWVIEFPDNTTISPEHQATIKELEKNQIQKCETRDIVKQLILVKTGVYYSVSRNYRILLKDK